MRASVGVCVCECVGVCSSALMMAKENEKPGFLFKTNVSKRREEEEEEVKASGSIFC